MKSSFGIINSRFHVISCRFQSDSNDSVVTSATLTLNDDSKHDQTIKLIGTGEQPEVLLSNGGEMYLRPTCIATSISRCYAVQNVGRLPLKYKWILTQDAKRFLQVEPQNGIIHSNEIQKHTWTFAPTECNKYIFKPKLVTSSLDGDSPRTFPMRVIGEGMEGEIKAEESFITFDSVITGTVHKRDINIMNDSLCDVHYRLSVEQFVNNDSGEPPYEREPIVLRVSPLEGILSARSHNTVTITISPVRRVNYTWTVYYQLLDKQGNTVPANNRYVLCELTANSVYPTLSVTDARAAGSGINISKTQLWRWFSLDHLNTSLDLDPEEPEVKYSVATRHSTSRRPSVYTKSVMDFNFGAAPVDSDPCDVIMLVKNTGCCELEWAFLFPKDLELEMDYWIESGEFTAEELHELHIQDNKLFEVHPKRGLLMPGDEEILTLTYKHDIPGTHRLPVLLKIDKGKEVLLNFIGVTVEIDRRYLHFGGTRHVFTPIPIGTNNPLKQLYEMYNGGSVSVIYEVDLSPLKQLQADNFNHPILTCLNPSGEIIPGTNGNLEWVFSPLESKTYEIDVPIHIIGGDTALLTFVGIGYDSRAMGKTMPMLDQPPEYTSVPKGQMLPLPGQMLFLSEERVMFRNVPLFSRNRHCIVLTNKSIDMPLSYSWHATSEVVNEVLRIDPIRGYLDPGQSSLTKITFCAAGQPSFYDLDLICEVTNELMYAEYEAELVAWEKERDRQQVEFVIQDTEDLIDEEETEFHVGPGKFAMKTTSSMRVLENVLNNRSDSVRLTESQVSKFSSKSDVKRFNTLPPIRYENAVKLPSNRSRTERKAEVVIDDKEWVRPTPPKPFITHLGVTARTHDITEYRSYFLKESEKHFIDKAMQVTDVVSASSASILSPADCIEEEKDTVMSIMTNLLRGLLDDPTVTEAFKDINNDKIPYFSHFNTSDSTHQEEEEESLSSRKAISEGSPSRFMDEILKQDEVKDSPQTSPKDVQVPPINVKEVTDPTKLTEKVKASAEFVGNLEDILSLTLSNIMEEALKGEVLLTARPRVVALPPSAPQSRATSSGKSSARSNATGGSKRRRRKKN